MMNRNAHAFANRTRAPAARPIPVDRSSGTPSCHPPKNRTAVSTENRNIPAYSARKKIANRNPVYSVWKPATSSLSASGRSKGARFSAASDAVKKRKKPANVAGLRKTHHRYAQPACCSTIDVRLSVPASTTTVRAEIASGISYETTCATSRIVPRIDHFELLDQPAMITPTTSMLEIESTKKSPMGRSAATHPYAKGSAANAANAPPKTM